MILYGFEWNLDAAAAGRLIDSDEPKRLLEDHDCRANGGIPLLLPDGIDDRFVAALQASAFLNRQPRQPFANFFSKLAAKRV